MRILKILLFAFLAVIFAFGGICSLAVEFSRHYNGQAVVRSNIITAIVALVLALVFMSLANVKKKPSRL
jgi:uncharacterized membrane protein YqjE